jgi:glucose-6-phosphate 1-dehydrogenase
MLCRRDSSYGTDCSLEAPHFVVPVRAGRALSPAAESAAIFSTYAICQILRNLQSPMNRPAEQPQSNPLREGLSTRAVPQPCTIVIFGATGDLTHRKLIPALYNLSADGELPPAVAVVGFARREKTDEDFRKEMEESTRQFSRQALRDEIWKTFAQSIFYHQSDFADESGYQKLADRLAKIDKEHGTRGNRLFYFAVAPDQFEPILKHLKAVGLNKAPEGSWARVIVEKPFGRDLASARELNRVVESSFAENQTYRIDHFLGKETAQNILVLRFANAIFEPLWNTRYIDHVQITAAETLGVEGRAGYYETAGALRDMVQNHLLQLLCLVAMDSPVDLGADSIRDEKVKVVRALRRMTEEQVRVDVVRGQYAEGAINGKSVVGYRAEKNIDPNSTIDTFVALRLHIDSWRWWDVPIYMRVGKRLPKSGTEISVHFKKAPLVLFNKETSGENVLVIRIQPDEGISLRMEAKVPGTSFRIEPVKMDFHYGTSFGKASPEAYERLLLDAMSGDATLFARRDEVEQAWAFIDIIEQAWANKKDPPPLFFYPAGSWGPEQADELLARDGRTWRRL